jgi:hypothetical protein
VIRARQETYSNGEMNQATSGSVSSMGIEEQESRKKKNKIGNRNRKKKTNKIGNKTRRKTRFEDKNLMILTMVNQSKGKRCFGVLAGASFFVPFSKSDRFGHLDIVLFC